MVTDKKSRKSAYWTQKPHLFRADEYICSSCSCSTGKAYTQCPSCGAMMRKSIYEPSWVDEAEMMDILWGK